MNKIVSFIVSILLCGVAISTARAKEWLFVRAHRNYDDKGVVGEAYRREFEPRMFLHNTWRQRLFCETADADADEAVEVYTRPDGSHWLCIRRATPALGPIIAYRPLQNQRKELAEKIQRVQISNCETLLPPELASDLERLWATMLPGLQVAPMPRTFPVHGPAFIGFARTNNAVKAGRMGIAAYGTPAYKSFLEVVSDLKILCTGDGAAKGDAVRRLLPKIKGLTARLGG